MQQVLYRDLAPIAQGLYYNGTPSNLLEVGYWGTAEPGVQGRDALTNAIHELGHVLGLSDALPTFANQISDGDYDFNPLFTRNTASAVKYHGPDPDDRDHVRSSDSVMAPGAGNGDRNLPSATDVFALASVAGWTQIDLPRKDYWGNGAFSWNNPINWAGNRVPDADDVVYVRGTGLAPLHANSQAGSLFVMESGEVNTVANTLDIQSTLTIEGGPEQTAHVNAMSGGRITDPLLLMRIVYGTSTFQGGSYTGGGVLNMNDTVHVAGNTTMDMHMVDMDGSGGTVMNLNNSRLTLNVAETDLFGGTMNVNGFLGGITVNLSGFSPYWGIDGTLNTQGGTAVIPQATIAGSPVRLIGTLNADDVSRILAPFTLSGMLNTADANTEVQLANVNNLIRNTAVLTGPGRLVVNANAGLAIEGGSSVGINLVNRGRLEPGVDTGVVAVNGNFQQMASGTLAMDIAGPPGFAHDRVNVAGSINLAGGLEVSVTDGFAPHPGFVYTLVQSSGRTGTFETFDLIASEIFTQLDATVSYRNNLVQLEFTNVAMLGDFDGNLALNCADVDALVAEIAAGGMQGLFDLNGDSLVNISDLDVWLSAAGTFYVGGPYLYGDANLDGNVDGSDFVVWNSNKFTAANGWCGGDFNADGVTDGSDFVIWNSNKFTSSSAVSAVVPEPALATIAVGLVLCYGVRRQLRHES